MDNENKTCMEIEPLLDALHDKELSSEERNKVEQHITACVDCQNKLNSIQSLVSSLKQIPKAEISAAAESRIDTWLDSNMNAKPKVIRLAPYFAAAGVAAALILCLSIAQTLTMRSPSNAPQATEIAEQVDNSSPSVAYSTSKTEAQVEAQDNSASKQGTKVIAHNNNVSKNIQTDNTVSKFEIATVTENSAGSLNDALGLATDEDGLYEFKI